MAAAALAAARSQLQQPPQLLLEQLAAPLLVPEADGFSLRTVSDRMDAELERLDMAPPLRAAVRTAIARCADPKDPVRRLLQARIRKALRALVVLQPEAAEGGQPPGISAEVRLVLPRIRRLAAKLSKLCGLNRAVHSPIYDELFMAAARRVLAAQHGAA